MRLQDQRPAEWQLAQLTLMGRIEIAKALLGRPRGRTSISVSHARPR